MSDQEVQDQRSRRFRISVSQIVGAVVLVAFVVFLLVNNRQVSVRFVFVDREISLSIALLIAGVLGALSLVLIQHRRRRK